jgi:TetR/AcrR family transcriptional repressor of nem operon
MARPREFDVDVALDRAMHAFWARGYEATSLDELCSATGLGRSSLYAAFGSKRGLYFETLERYEQLVVQRLAAAFAGPRPVREAVAGFVGGLIDDIVSGPGRRGCFIGNCAAELSRQDRRAAGKVRQSLELIEGAFREALARARERGELATDFDVAATARFLTSGIQGLRLIGKANPDRAVLGDIAATMLRCLDR